MISVALCSKVLITKSVTLSKIAAGSYKLYSLTALFKALLQITLTIAPGTPWPVQSATAINKPFGVSSIQ